MCSQQTCHQPFEFCTVSCGFPWFTVHVGCVTDGSRGEDLDLSSELVEFCVIDEDKGDGRDVSLLQCPGTHMHLVFGNFAPTVCEYVCVIANEGRRWLSGCGEERRGGEGKERRTGE